MLKKRKHELRSSDVEGSHRIDALRERFRSWAGCEGITFARQGRRLLRQLKSSTVWTSSEESGDDRRIVTAKTLGSVAVLQPSNGVINQLLVIARIQFPTDHTSCQSKRDIGALGGEF